MIDDEKRNNIIIESIIPAANSVGFVEEKFFTYDGLTLKCGKRLPKVTICYETYGTLSPERDNAILISHALSGSAHAAGYHTDTDRKPGWWEGMIGPGKAFDTEKYFIVSPNALGSCYGTTGPTSINPDTGKPYQGDFPVVTIEDMVEAAVPLMDELGIDKWLAVAGGSMGGMIALQWGIAHPDKIGGEIIIASSAAINAQGLALSYIGRQAILRDPKWCNGFYPPEDPPAAGLSVARMVGHVTYVCEASLERKFGRRLQSADDISNTLDGIDFQVESYLNYQGEQFVRRFDANAYLLISRALEYYDPAAKKESLTEALKPAVNPALILSFTSDWIYPPATSGQVYDALRANGVDCAWHNIESDLGHDAFLIETQEQTKFISAFLEQRHAAVRG